MPINLDMNIRNWNTHHVLIKWNVYCMLHTPPHHVSTAIKTLILLFSVLSQILLTTLLHQTYYPSTLSLCTCDCACWRPKC